MSGLLIRNYLQALLLVGRAALGRPYVSETIGMGPNLIGHDPKLPWQPDPKLFEDGSETIRCLDPRVFRGLDPKLFGDGSETIMPPLIGNYSDILFGALPQNYVQALLLACWAALERPSYSKLL